MAGVLSGCFGFWCADDYFELAEGGCIALPRGVPHRFRNIGEEEGILMVVVTPGGFENFFPIIELCKPETPEQIASVAMDFGLTEASKLTVEIDPTSVRTDYPWPDVVDFDAKISGDPDFLAGKPIRFVSSTIRITGERTGIVEGVLTFRDETHPLPLTQPSTDPWRSILS